MGSRPTPPAAWGPTLVQTRMATRLVEDKEAYLGGSGSRPIGRRIDGEQHELFVVCAPADALTLELEHLTPDFIALHDMGTAQAMAVLQATAHLARKRVQRLSIRRQGYGDTLTTLHFVELPRADGRQQFRVYATAAEGGDQAENERVAATLLGHSRLGVLLAGRRADADRALHALEPTMGSAAWRNRALIVLPMSGEALKPDPMWPRPDGLTWHDAPPCASAQAAWQAAARLWNQLQLGDPIRLPDATAAAAASPPPAVADATAMPASSALPTPQATREPAAPRLHDATAVASATPPWQTRLNACAALPGFVSGCVFELSSQRTLGHAGSRPGPASLASHGASMLVLAQSTARKMGLPHGLRTMVCTLEQHHLVLSPLPDGQVLHAVFDAGRVNAAVLQATLGARDR